MSEEVKKTELKVPKKLPDAVAAKYELLNGHEAGKFLLPGGKGVIDLSTISLERAAQLAADKTVPFFVAKNQGASSASASTAASSSKTSG